ESAEIVLRTLLMRAPRCLPAARALSILLYKKTKYKEARSVIEEFLSTSSQHEQSSDGIIALRLLQIQTFIKLKMTKDAFKASEKLTLENKENIELIKRHAKFAGSLSKYEAAIRALKLIPTNKFDTEINELFKDYRVCQKIKFKFRKLQ